MLYNLDGNILNVASQIGNVEKRYKDNGVFDALSVAKQFCTIPWKTTENGMPNGRNGNLSKGQTVIGLPYSSASVEDGYIGINISPYTFMTAVHNPRSVLYTKTSKGYAGYAYYGTVCTSLICAAWGIPCLITTVAFPKTNLLIQKNKENVELGDMLLSGDHAKIVSGIRRDDNGTITHVRVSESTYNHCIENTYQSYADFISSHSAYTLYRYKYIDCVDIYSASEFFNIFDETKSGAEYSDIVTEYGDKVTRKNGTDITINVLETDGYDTINVYQDNVLIDTITSIEDFTLTDLDEGLYEVRMTGGDKTASTFFDIVDATIDVTGSSMHYSATYGAVAVGGFPSYTTDATGKATSWNNPKRIHIITEAEDVERTVDITEMINDSDCDGGVRLYIRGVYGSVSFEYKYA